MQDGSVVQEGQVGHISRLFVFGRVYLSDYVELEVLIISTLELHRHQFTEFLILFGALELGLFEATLAIGDPIGFFRVVGLGLEIEEELLIILFRVCKINLNHSWSLMTSAIK